MKIQLRSQTAIALFFIFLITSCTSKEKKQEVIQQPALDSTLLIKGPCAIFVSPDTLEIDSLKTILGEDDFNTVADDYVYYLGDAKHMLDSAGINVISTEEDTLKFLMSDGSVFSISSKDSSTLFPVYYFNGNEPPTLVEVMDGFKDQFDNVFSK